MIKNKTKVICLILVIILNLGVCGCMDDKYLVNSIENMEEDIKYVTDTSVDIVTDKLEKKYNCKFVADSIGNRYDTGSATVYLHPETDSKIIFTAVIDEESGEIKDDYIERVVAEKIKNKVEEKFTSSGVNVALSVLLYGSDSIEETNQNITCDEYFEKYDVQSVHFYLVIDENTLNSETPVKVESILNECYNLYNSNIAVLGYVICDKFEECKSELDVAPDISNTWFSTYNPVRTFKCSISNGKLSTSGDSLSSELLGDD